MGKITPPCKIVLRLSGENGPKNFVGAAKSRARVRRDTTVLREEASTVAQWPCLPSPFLLHLLLPTLKTHLFLLQPFRVLCLPLFVLVLNVY